MRIFHESFRRFMREELSRLDRSVADVLAPVVAWLDKRGFQSDAKAYRFLLPALQRAGRGQDVLSRVDVCFVSDSIMNGHSADAVKRNLALAANVAAQTRDWPTLVRCIELHRSADVSFDYVQGAWVDYWGDLPRDLRARSDLRETAVRWSSNAAPSNRPDVLFTR